MDLSFFVGLNILQALYCSACRGYVVDHPTQEVYDVGMQPFLIRFFVGAFASSIGNNMLTYCLNDLLIVLGSADSGASGISSSGFALFSCRHSDSPVTFLFLQFRRPLPQLWPCCLHGGGLMRK